MGGKGSARRKAMKRMSSALKERINCQVIQLLRRGLATVSRNFSKRRLPLRMSFIFCGGKERSPIKFGKRGGNSKARRADKSMMTAPSTTLVPGRESGVMKGRHNRIITKYRPRPSV